MSTNYSKYVLIILCLQTISRLKAEHVYYSEPNLTHPYIDKELLDSCGLRYGVLPHTIKYNKSCFLNESIVDRMIPFQLIS